MKWSKSDSSVSFSFGPAKNHLWMLTTLGYPGIPDLKNCWDVSVSAQGFLSSEIPRLMKFSAEEFLGSLGPGQSKRGWESKSGSWPAKTAPLFGPGVAKSRFVVSFEWMDYFTISGLQLGDPPQPLNSRCGPSRATAQSPLQATSWARYRRQTKPKLIILLVCLLLSQKTVNVLEATPISNKVDHMA